MRLDFGLNKIKENVKLLLEKQAFIISLDCYYVSINNL